jgi:hypothetical protein
MRKAWMVAAAVLLLPGCVTRPTDINHPLYATKGRDTCGYRKHAHLIGQPVTALGAPRETDGSISIYKPGDLELTVLYPANLNVYLDESDIIVRMSCG